MDNETYTHVDTPSEAISGHVHVDQHRRVRQQSPQRGFEERSGRVDIDAAGGQQAADDFRDLQPLGDAEGITMTGAKYLSPCLSPCFSAGTSAGT